LSVKLSRYNVKQELDGPRFIPGQRQGIYFCCPNLPPSNRCVSGLFPCR